MDGVDQDRLIKEAVDRALAHDEIVHTIHDLMLVQTLKALMAKDSGPAAIEVARKVLGQIEYTPPSMLGTQRSGSQAGKAFDALEELGIDVSQIPAESLKAYEG